METLTGLIAAALSGLRSLVAPEVCPGGFAWAVSALGVVVGLLPAVGAVIIAVLRRRIGSRYGTVESLLLAGLGLLTAGVLPLLAFSATGQVFATAAAGQPVPGLTRADLRSLGTAECVAGPQDEYLGVGTVGDAFDPSDPVRFSIAVLLLALLPVVVTLLVAALARIALRRGPSWPARFFWIPTLALVVLTASDPAGSSEHLWVGAAGGALLGIPLVLMVGVPSREVVRRSLAAPPTPPGPASSGPSGPGPVRPHRSSPTGWRSASPRAAPNHPSSRPRDPRHWTRRPSCRSRPRGRPWSPRHPSPRRPPAHRLRTADRPASA